MQPLVPIQVAQQILTDTLEECPLGRTGNLLFRATTPTHGRVYLKIGSGAAARDIRREAARLRWIGTRLRVPRVLTSDSVGDVAYLLITEVPGVAAHHAVERYRPERVVKALALALRKIHGLPVEKCPFRVDHEREIVRCRRWLRSGRIGTSEFLKTTQMTPLAALRELEELQFSDTDLVFTHGDYALPNVLVVRSGVAGVIDWSQAAVADRHRDFMCIEKSIARNCGAHWVDAFYEAYGHCPRDPRRVRYFWLLDQFDAHHK